MLRYFNRLRTTQSDDNIFKHMTLDQFRQALQMQCVLQCPVGSEYFRLFCLKERNEENLLCLMELLALETSTSEQEVALGLQEIYKRFLALHAKEEVNVSYPTLKTLRNKYETEKDNIALFEPIKAELQANMSDPFGRFKHSEYSAELYEVVRNLDIFRAKMLNSGKKKKSLNESFPWNLPVRSGFTASSHILEEIVNYLRQHSANLLAPQGEIKYRTVTGLLWNKVAQQINELQKIDLKSLTENERKATFINIYNLLMIHGVLQQEGLPHCNVAYRCFTRKTRYNIGGALYSLDEIYNGILRDNKKDWVFGQRFNKKDSRYDLVLSNDFRIHFALLTMDTISPAFKIASADALDDYLDERTTEYLNRYVSLNQSVLTLPKVFYTYRSDLGKNGIEEFVAKYTTKLSATQKELLLNNKYKIEFEQTPRLTNFACVLNVEALLSDQVDVSDLTRKEIEKTVAKKQQRTRGEEEPTGPISE